MKASGEDHSKLSCIAQAKTVVKSLGGIVGSTVEKSEPVVSASKPASGTAASKSDTTGAPKTSTPANGANVPTMLLPEKDDWTTAQQVALEAALKKYPASAFSKNPAERCDKIASDIDGKDKKQVKTRLKVLQDLQKKASKK